MTSIEIFNSETNDFEQLSKENGFKYWFARDLMIALGYDDYRKFIKAIERAISTCISLQITVDENFISIESSTR